MTVQQLVAAGGPAFIFLIAAVDLACLVTRWSTPGEVIQWWAQDHPFLAAGFAGFVGAFAAHIFWHT
jgi:hypothetical protein